VGDTDEGRYRHVGGSSSIYLSESEFEFVDGRAELQVTHVDALLCLAKRIKNGALLFAKETQASGAAVYN